MRFGFQLRRMHDWLVMCFGSAILDDKEERIIRLTEEVLELAQAEGMTREQATGLVKQVFDKPVGDVFQELGGVMVCLSAYVLVAKQDPELAFEVELTRIEQPSMIEKIRAKWLTKSVVSSQSERARS